MHLQEAFSPDLIGYPELEPGQVVGEYVVDRRLAVGGFGVVFAATHPVIGKRAAIKMLAPEFSSNPRYVDRFLAEARAVNEIRHRHIVDIFGFGQLEDSRHYYVMELLEGLPLDEFLKVRGCLPLSEALPILDGIALALDAAHTHGIIHRDLKPENVFLVREEDGSFFPKLLDFGVAKSLNEESREHFKTKTGCAVGTLPYMSPEQCRGRDVDYRSDIYAFGVLTYRMLTGKLPHDGEEAFEVYEAKIRNEITAPSAINSQISALLDVPILATMDVEPYARPASAACVIESLQTIDDGLSVIGQTTRSPNKAPGSNPGWSFIALAASLLLFGFALLFSVSQGWATREVSSPKSVAAEEVVLRFGYRRSIPQDVLEERFSGLTEYLSQALGGRVEFETLPQNSDLRDGLASGRLSMAVINPLGYVTAKRSDPGVRIVAAQVNPGGSTFEGYIIARVGSDVRQLSDLDGRAFCFVPDSTSGYLYPRLMLHEAGVEPKRIVYAADHVWAMRHLQNGECDGAAVYSYTYLDARSYNIAPNAFTIISKTARIPNDVLVVSSEMDSELYEKIRTAILALSPESSQARKIFSSTGEIIGFQEADAKVYEGVRKSVQSLEL